MRTLPGFGGRLGRLAFLGRSLALGAVTMILTLVLILALVPRGHAAGAAMPRGPVAAVVVIVVPFFLYGSLSLQARRFRDIGWSPALMIGGWMAVELIDLAMAQAVPALARPGGGTGLGAIVNLVLSVALIFKPGQPEDAGRGGDYHRPEPPARSRAPAIERPAAPRSVPGMGPAAAPVAAGFGRRGL